MRPLFTLSSYLLIADDWKRALQVACAVECIHTYSLIHDDLPCMDNDDLRRGRPTLHKVYPEWLALLAGDALLTRAFELLASAPHLSEETRLRLISCLAREAGPQGMVGGQMLDMFKSSRYEELAQKKTATLFIASLQMGALAAQAPPSLLNLLDDLGTHFGLLFQALDDQKDQDSSHPTPLALYREKTLHLLSSLPGNKEPLASLIYQTIQ